jgi:hypothetical protein
MNGINEARQRRQIIASSVSYYLSNNDVLKIAGDCLEWDDFERLPEWFMWDEDRLHRLVLIAGTVFLLPSIRLWIEAKKIHIVQNLIGKPVYEFIMQYTQVDNSPVMQIDIENLHSLMKKAGASVILSSQESRLHPWLVAKLPEAKGQLKRKVATELMNHALFILTQTEIITNNSEDKYEGKGIGES